LARFAKDHFDQSGEEQMARSGLGATDYPHPKTETVNLGYVHSAYGPIPMANHLHWSARWFDLLLSFF
jgi:hypothetical protein